MLAVKVWGDYACFTRPENKVERVSYPVITPSAARGLLEAIFWKPEVRWHVQAIAILKPIKFFSIKTIEVKSRASPRAAQRWGRTGGGYYADEDHTPRHTLGLRDVSYILYAEMVLRPHATEGMDKYTDQFLRRVARGQCHHTPYFGCREFAAAFGPPDGTERPIAYTADLGRMLGDLNYVDGTSGRGAAQFFHATVQHGVMAVPPLRGEVRVETICS